MEMKKVPRCVAKGGEAYGKTVCIKLSHFRNNRMCGCVCLRRRSGMILTKQWLFLDVRNGKIPTCYFLYFYSFRNSYLHEYLLFL